MQLDEERLSPIRSLGLISERQYGSITVLNQSEKHVSNQPDFDRMYRASIEPPLYHESHICSALNTMHGGNTFPVKVPENITDLGSLSDS